MEKLKLIRDSGRHSKIDTLTNYENDRRGFLLLVATDSHGFGDIDFYYVISKQISETQTISYKIENANRVSKQFFAFARVERNPNWGWISLKDGKIVDELPSSKRLLDSLKSTVQNDVKILMVGDKFIFKRNEKTFKELSYGDLVTKYKNFDFENINHELYKLQGDSIIILSENINDLLKQPDGIYFIPKPGYGIVNKYDRKEILDAIDSVSKLPTQPQDLEFNPVK